MNTYFHPGNYQMTLNNQPFQMAQVDSGNNSAVFTEVLSDKQPLTVDNDGQPVFAGSIYFLFFMLALGITVVYMVVINARKNGVVKESPYAKDNSAFKV